MGSASGVRMRRADAGLGQLQNSFDAAVSHREVEANRLEGSSTKRRQPYGHGSEGDRNILVHLEPEIVHCPGCSCAYIDATWSHMEVFEDDAGHWVSLLASGSSAIHDGSNACTPSDTREASSLICVPPEDR